MSKERLKTPIIRRLKRQAKTPVALRNFEVGCSLDFKRLRNDKLENSDIADFTCNFIIDELFDDEIGLSQSDATCMSTMLLFSSVVEPNEPNSYDEAMNCSESDFWKAAIKKELDTISQTKTWEPSILPINKKPLTCKWV